MLAYYVYPCIRVWVTQAVALLSVFRHISMNYFEFKTALFPNRATADTARAHLELDEQLLRPLEIL